MKNRLIIPAVFLLAVFSFFNSCISKTDKKNKIDIASNVPITLPHKFKSPKAEQLSINAFALNKQGKHDEAIEIYKEAIEIEPDNPKLYFDLSECYTRVNRANETIAALKTAIKLDDSCAAFYNNLGLIYWQLYKDQDALDNYKKAIKLDSNYWGYYYNMSLAYYGNKEFSEACKSFNKSKQLGLNEYTLRNDNHLALLEKLCK